MRNAAIKQDQNSPQVSAVALIIAKDDDFNRTMIKQLWQAGIEALLTTSLIEAQKMIIQFLPDFIFLPYDHPDYQKVSLIARKFSRLKTTQFVAYAESEISSSIVRIAQYQTKQAIHPPLNAESFLKFIRGYINQVPHWSEVRWQKKDLLSGMKEKTSVDKKIIGEAITWALKKASKVNPKKAPQEIGTVTHVTAAWINHPPFVGYIMGTIGGNEDEETQFFENFGNLFSDSMREKGIKIENIKFHPVNIRKTHFLPWIGAQAEYQATDIHDQYEVGIGFFNAPLLSIQPFDVLKKGMAELNLKNIDTDIPPPVPYYIYAETQSSYNILFKKGVKIRPEEIQKLKERNLTHLNVHQTDIEAFLIHNMQTFINDKVEEYNAAKRAQEFAEKQRMSDELELASTVQETLFPEPFYEDSYIKVKGYYRTSSECGGDWWYYCTLGDKVYFFIGDATGHGVPAALVCSATKATAGLLIHFPSLPLPGLMTMINHAIYGTSKGKILMTFFIGCLNLKSQELTVCNASHEQPLIFPNKETLKKSDITPLAPPAGPRLGESLKSTYTEEIYHLNPSDRIFFYSDGVTELKNNLGEQWSEQKMIRVLLKSFQQGPGIDRALLDLESQMELFRAGAPLADDITYFMVDFKKEKPKD